MPGYLWAKKLYNRDLHGSASTARFPYPSGTEDPDRRLNTVTPRQSSACDRRFPAMAVGQISSAATSQSLTCSSCLPVAFPKRALPSRAHLRDLFLRVVIRIFASERSMAWQFGHRVEWDRKVAVGAATDA